MILIKNGDLLKCKEDIIVHQVNVDGIMGGGVAKQIAEKYPQTEKEYKEFCKKHDFSFEKLYGKVDLTKEKGKYIANMFSQYKSFATSYNALEIALTKIRNFAEQEKLTVAMPFKIGCGIANGEWEIVQDIINKVFKGYTVNLYKLEV